jgi:hypothetical protein
MYRPSKEDLYKIYFVFFLNLIKFSMNFGNLEFSGSKTKLKKWEIRRTITSRPFRPGASQCRPSPKAKTARVAQLAGAARCTQRVITAHAACAVAWR